LHCCQGLDRAQTQAADQITVHLTHSSDGVVIKQNPTALKGAHIRVGAAVWDGAYVLAAYLDAQPAGSFQGLRCVELGCGCGLLGLVLARLGAAAVYVTDKAQHLVGPRVNAAKNRLLAPAAAAAAPVRPPPRTLATQEGTAAGGSQQAAPSQQQQQQQQQSTCTPQQPAQQPQSSAAAASSSPAVVQVAPLDWEDESAMGQSVAAIRTQGQIDLIVASDCIYPGVLKEIVSQV
jgi:predicted nicotinamide N-methyase